GSEHWSLKRLRGLGGTASKKERLAIREFADDLDQVVRAVRTGTVGRALGVVVEQVGLARAMKQLDDRPGGDGTSHLDDLDALRQVAGLHPEALTFEGWLRGVLRRRSVAAGVTLSTIHRAKGMEWD